MAKKKKNRTTEFVKSTELYSGVCDRMNLRSMGHQGEGSRHSCGCGVENVCMKLSTLCKL